MANRLRAIMGADWANLVVGLVVLATPYFTGQASGATLWNCLVVGLVVAGLSIWNMVAARSASSRQLISSSTVNLLAGVYLIALPFLVGSNMAYRVACIVEGVVLVVMSGFVAWFGAKLRRTLTGRTA